MTKINTSRPVQHMYGSLSVMLLLLVPVRPSEAQLAPPSPHGLRRVNPSTAIIIAVLISAFFLMGFFSVYLRKCAGDSVSSGAQRLGTHGRSRRAAATRGLDRTVIESFPTFDYSVVKELKLGKGTLECAVCLNEFEEEETLRLIPKCNHVFHPDCIDAWLGTHTTCPVCRSNLVPGSDPPPAETMPDAETVTEAGAISAEVIDQVAIDVRDESADQISIQDRPIRSKSTRRPLKFSRSHTTGHSLVPLGENVERFTLRLPEHVRKEIVEGKLSRTTSCGVVLALGAEGGSDSGGRKGDRTDGRWEGSGPRRSFQFGRFDRKAKSDRWGFSLAPPFFTRTASAKSCKGVDGEQTANGKGLFPSVKTPFDCLGAKDQPTAEQAAARGSAPVFTVSTE